LKKLESWKVKRFAGQPEKFSTRKHVNRSCYANHYAF
jgi:hypothetical protein